jgi:hypothetical protein
MGVGFGFGFGFGFACGAGGVLDCVFRIAIEGSLIILVLDSGVFFAYGVGVCFGVFCLRGAWLSVRLWRWALLDLAFFAFGLSLNSYWFISVAPVRGRHLLFFACRKEK